MSARVRVKRSVSNPTYGWGSVAHDKVGIVKRVDPDGDLKVDFPEHSGWTGKSSEMEVITARSQPDRTGRRQMQSSSSRPAANAAEALG